MTYTIAVCSVKTPDHEHRNGPKHVEFYSKNKFEKSVHLFGFIIRIYHDARSPERQIHVSFCQCELVDSPASSISVVSLTENCS